MCIRDRNQGIFRHPLPELLDVPLVAEFGFGVFAIVTLNPGLLRPALTHSHVDLLPEIYFWKIDPNALFDSVPVNYRSVILKESDHRMIKGLAGVVCCAIQTDFTWRNSLIDSCPLSLPLPERLYPPKGLMKLTAR